MEKNLSVILIAHNEEQNIGRMIEGLLRQYERQILEVVVVDDCSTDSTAQIAESLMKRERKLKLVKRAPPPGVGRALKTGFNNIDPKAQYVLSMDSDFTESISEVRSLIQKIEEGGYDGVIGSRFIKGSRLIAYPFMKRLMNRSFHFLVKTLFHIRQNDLTNNFKLYKASIFRDMPWRSDDFSMNAETGILPILAGYRIEEVPVSWAERSSHMGKSKFSIHKVGWSYVEVIFYAWRFLKTKTPH
ncbi:MAG TPA: glycosyltransferase family 2 protein [Patescibacteria group bacterium]|nr:glycosyltransferase family 2 protein [Patescibacteria group bacterium]